VVEKWGLELRDFGRPFVLMGIGGWLVQNADRWIVAFLFGNDQAGLFNLAGNVAGVVPSFVSAGLMQRVFPSIFRQADQAKSPADWRRLAGRCDRVTMAFLGLTVAGLAMLHLLGPYLTGWLISKPNYGPSMPLLFPAGIAAAAVQTNQFQYLLLQGQHNSLGMVKVMSILATIRTLGSILAGMVSWSAFVIWLLISTAIIALLGRALIRRLALADFEEPRTPVLVDSSRG
jgi:O-antigen/teichoic acid export membrane protein